MGSCQLARAASMISQIHNMKVTNTLITQQELSNNFYKTKNSRSTRIIVLIFRILI